MQKQEAGRFRRFMEEKGFYIVLFLCLTAIGIGGYLFFSDPAEEAVGLDSSYTTQTTAATTRQSVQAFSGETTRSSTQLPEETAAATTAESAAATTAKKAAYTMPVKGAVLTSFSGSTLVYDKTTGDWRTHNGVDLAAAEGDPVCAIADGQVADLYHDSYYGTVILVQHSGGLQSVYMGLARECSVKNGDAVKAGQQLGTVDSSVLFESGIQSHIHLEVLQDGERVDPMKLIEAQ